MSGTLYLIPNELAENTNNAVIPTEVEKITLSLKHYIVENVKVTRRFLKKLDRTKDIDLCVFYPMGKHADENLFPSYIDVLKNGSDMGLISDAGLPAIADPGSVIVRLAHNNNIKVVPLVGPSSILLALMASGLNGQSFSFHGYLPHDQGERTKKIKALESNMRNSGTTQIFMDTPFRNNKLIEELIQTCHPSIILCVAANITGDGEKIISKSIREWKKTKYDFHKIPAMICIGQ